MSHLTNHRAPRRIVPRVVARPCKACYMPLLPDERVLCRKCQARQKGRQ